MTQVRETAQERVNRQRMEAGRELYHRVHNPGEYYDTDGIAEAHARAEDAAARRQARAARKPQPGGIERGVALFRSARGNVDALSQLAAPEPDEAA